MDMVYGDGVKIQRGVCAQPAVVNAQGRHMVEDIIHCRYRYALFSRGSDEIRYRLSAGVYQAEHGVVYRKPLGCDLEAVGLEKGPEPFFRYR